MKVPLSYFPPGDGFCHVCEEFGACRDWIVRMADDLLIPEEWLAAKVYLGEIDYTWGPSDVERYYSAELG